MNEKYNIIELEKSLSFSNNPYIKFKIIVIGDASVGKTNIIKAYTTNSYNENTKPTLGVEFYTKYFEINKDYVMIEIWDTAGQEKFQSVTNSYYRGSQGALIVYDIANEESFNNIGKWLERANEKLNENAKIILVGNKIDLADQRKVQTETALEKAQELNMPLMETSALENKNIKEVFEMLLLYLYEEYEKEKIKNKKIKKKEKEKEKKKKDNLNIIEEGINLDTNEEGKKKESIDLDENEEGENIEERINLNKNEKENKNYYCC